MHFRGSVQIRTKRGRRPPSAPLTIGTSAKYHGYLHVSLIDLSKRTIQMGWIASLTGRIGGVDLSVYKPAYPCLDQVDLFYYNNSDWKKKGKANSVFLLEQKINKFGSTLTNLFVWQTTLQTTLFATCLYYWNLLLSTGLDFDVHTWQLLKFFVTYLLYWPCLNQPLETWWKHI